MNPWLQTAACFAAAVGFSLMLNQPRGTILVSSLVAAAGYGMFLLLGQSTAAYFFATLLIAVSCEICARIMKKVATLFLTSALIPLVPGVGLYRTMRYIVEGAFDQAVKTGTDTLLGIFASALAVIISSLFFVNFHRAPRKGTRP